MRVFLVSKRPNIFGVLLIVVALTSIFIPPTNNVIALQIRGKKTKNKQKIATKAATAEYISQNSNPVDGSNTAVQATEIDLNKKTDAELAEIIADCFLFLAGMAAGIAFFVTNENGYFCSLLGICIFKFFKLEYKMMVEKKAIAQEESGVPQTASGEEPRPTHADILRWDGRKIDQELKERSDSFVLLLHLLLDYRTYIIALIAGVCCYWYDDPKFMGIFVSWVAWSCLHHPTAEQGTREMIALIRHEEGENSVMLKIVSATCVFTNQSYLLDEARKLDIEALLKRENRFRPLDI